MKKYIPNFLTLLRVILVPIFIWFVFFASIKYHLIWGLVIFIIASITDYYDGMLARRFKVISDFGKVMDPLADKILITAVDTYNNSATYIIEMEIIEREVTATRTTTKTYTWTLIVASAVMETKNIN